MCVFNLLINVIVRGLKHFNVVLISQTERYEYHMKWQRYNSVSWCVRHFSVVTCMMGNYDAQNMGSK